MAAMLTTAAAPVRVVVDGAVTQTIQTDNVEVVKTPQGLDLVMLRSPLIFSSSFEGSP